ncbi:hypothetical protein OSTOST_14044, partial [Ostertagia ostertagi]
VAAFAVSPYPNSTGRFRKFFNPLLGETYEYEQEDFKYHGEQGFVNTSLLFASPEGAQYGKQARLDEFSELPAPHRLRDRNAA